MKKKYFLLILSISISISFILLGNGQFTFSPPFGKIFDPWKGVWANVEKGRERFEIWPAYMQKNFRKEFPDITEVPQLYFDKEAIAYIFSSTEEGLYFAQGYNAARERLWQMDMMWRASSGRLSEVVGDRAFQVDQKFLRMGMHEAVQNALKTIRKNPQSWKPLQSYVKGVNRYIEGLSFQDYPIEYKLMGFEPELWSEEKSLFILKRMAYDLSWVSTDIEMSRLRHKLTEEEIADLFPLYPTDNEPIIPKGTKWPLSVKLPKPPKENFKADLSILKAMSKPDRDNGSNNWAIGPSKSATGSTIVANDTHLSFSLPALWYKVQLQMKGDSPVAGSALPGFPGVVIGFNNKISWAVTNAVVDVTDFYEIDLRQNSFGKEEYLFEGEWRLLEQHSYPVQIKGQEDHTEKVLWTHYGPIIHRDENKGLVLRWLAHDKGDDLSVFLSLNRAYSFKECWRALQRFVNPAQNFICSDKDNIGLMHNGRIPLKWKNQGKFVGDGSSQIYQWPSFLNRSQNPQVINPKRGFVSSANNHPTDESYPYYLNFFYSSAYRNRRIVELLSEKEVLSADDLQRIQNDNFSLHAVDSLPWMLDSIDLHQLTEDEKKILHQVSKWNKEVLARKIEPTIWYKWWKVLEEEVWGDQLGDISEVIYPSKNRLVRLLKSPETSKWWDDTKTSSVIEDKKIIVTRSFKKTLDLLKESWGKSSNWQWAKVKRMKIEHIGKIPGFSSPLLWVGGEGSTINSNKGPHGPNWKMVVELGEKPRARMIYPGGQSGNPASRYYDSFVQRWAKGELIPFQFKMEEDFVREKKGGGK